MNYKTCFKAAIQTDGEISGSTLYSSQPTAWCPNRADGSRVNSNEISVQYRCCFVIYFRPETEAVQPSLLKHCGFGCLWQHVCGCCALDERKSGMY